jgi:hypothetical protein
MAWTWFGLTCSWEQFKDLYWACTLCNVCLATLWRSWFFRFCGWHIHSEAEGIFAIAHHWHGENTRGINQITTNVPLYNLFNLFNQTNMTDEWCRHLNYNIVLTTIQKSFENVFLLLFFYYLPTFLKNCKFGKFWAKSIFFLI